MSRRKVLLGTLMLSGSALFVRMIGFVFRVYLSNTIGAEGMGVYSLIMSVYALSITVATSGISGAVAKLAAEEFAIGKAANARRILRRSIGLSLILSCVVGTAMLLLSKPVAVNILGDARTEMSLMFLAPGLPFLSVCGCLRGYFIAGRKMGNPASAQIIEQLFKMGFIIAFLGVWLPRGIEWGCALVVLGMTLGEAVCLLYTLAGYLLEKRGHASAEKADATGITGSILRFALPVSLSAYIRSGLRLAEDILIVSGLKSHAGDDSAATGTYGVLRGMVMPLLIFPLSLLSAFIMTLTPEISRLGVRDSAGTRLSGVISRVLQVTSIAGVFIVCALVTFGGEIGMAVYHDAQVGVMLRSMAWLCPFMCLDSVTVSILHGLGSQTHSAFYSVADCVLRVLLVWTLIPRYGVSGFIAMVVISNLFTSLLNLRLLLRITGLGIQWGCWIIKPVLSGLAASQAVKALFRYVMPQELAAWQGLALGLIIAASVYLASLFALGCVTREDLSWVLARLRTGSRRIPVADASDA